MPLRTASLRIITIDDSLIARVMSLWPSLKHRSESRTLIVTLHDSWSLLQVGVSDALPAK